MAERIDGDKYPSNPTDWKEEKIVQMQDALAFCGWSIMDQQNIMDPDEGFISEHDGKPAHRHLISKFDMLADMAFGLTKNKEMIEEGAWHEVDEDGDIVVYHYTQEVAEQLQQCFAKAFEVARLNAHDLFEAIFQMQTTYLIYQADPENFNLGHIPLSLNQVQALLDNSESEEQQAQRRQNVMRQTCMNILIQLGCALHNAESGETAIIPHLIPEGLQPMVEGLFGDLVHEEESAHAPKDADDETIRSIVAERMAQRVHHDDASTFTDEDIDSYDDDPFGAELWEEE